MKRPIILRWGGLFGTHPRATKTSESRSGSLRPEFVAGGATVLFSASAGDAIASTICGQWMEALAAGTGAAVIAYLWRAWERYETARLFREAIERQNEAAALTALRWQAAARRQEELIALRAERVRRKKAVKDIDAELKPLTNRMMSGAI